MAGNGSLIVAPVTSLGPALVTTIVYVVAVPGTAVEVLLVLAMRRSAVGTSVLTSVAVLFPRSRSATFDGGRIVARLVNAPEAAGAMLPVTVYVIVLPFGRFTRWSMGPVPLVGNPEAPPVCVAVQVTPVSVAVIGSFTAAPVTSTGPALVTTMVYVMEVPGIDVVWPSVLVMRRSAIGKDVSAETE